MARGIDSTCEARWREVVMASPKLGRQFATSPGIMYTNLQLEVMTSLSLSLE